MDEAQKLKENAEKKLKEYDKIINSSKNEAKKILQDGYKNLENELEKMYIYLALLLATMVVVFEFVGNP